MKTLRTNKFAYSFIELMMALSILMIISASAIAVLNAVRKNHAIEETEAGLDLREIAKQEFLFQGLNTEEAINPLEDYGDVSSKIEKTNSPLNIPGKNDISLMSAKFDTQRDRIHVVGKVIKDEGTPQEIQESILLPPIANFFGTVSLTTFPIKNFISSVSSNPLGTYYRYTTDGSDPVMSSPVWTFADLSLTQWSSRMKFRAFNQDSRYTESPVLEVALILTGDIILQREDGSNSLGVLYSELVNNANRIGLMVPGKDPNVSIQYRIKGGHNQEYQGPFHFPLHEWNSSGLTFVAEIRVPQCNEPIKVQEFNLHIKKEQLAAPEIISLCDAGCQTGSIVSIKANRNMANTVTTVDGQDAMFYVKIEDV